MPDIDIACPECKKHFRVSEFITSETITCPNCDAQVPLAAPGEKREPSKPKKKLVLKEIVDLTPEERGEPPAEEWTFSEQMESSKRETPKPKLTHHIASWSIFLVLGGLMGGLKYGNIVETDLSTFWKFSPYIVIAFNVLVVIKALKDDIFQGLLCLLVPFYWIYYLFSVSDDFYMRSVCAGLLVGVAEDSFYFFNDLWMHVYTQVTEWILAGGGEV
jgi:hypothetical protein